MSDMFKNIYESIKREVQYHRFINDPHLVNDIRNVPNARIYGNVRCYTCDKYIIGPNEPYSFMGSQRLGWRLFCCRACYERYLTEMREMIIETS